MTDVNSKNVGIYKEKFGNGVSVHVHGGVLDIPEQLYRDKGYEPPIEKLPWKEDYTAPSKAPVLTQADDERTKEAESKLPRPWRDD